MWNRLKQADITEARQQLDLRRHETLRKHAEEMQLLAADQAAIETLDDLVSAFAAKFQKLRAPADLRAAPTAPSALSAAIEPPAAIQSPITVKPATTIKPNENRVPHRHVADKPAPKIRHADRRGHRTNFETYLHAIVKNERGW